MYTSAPYARIVNRFGATPYAPVPLLGPGPGQYQHTGRVPGYNRAASRLPRPVPTQVSVADSEAFNGARLIGSWADEWQRHIHPNGSSYWVYYWANATLVVSDIEPPLFSNSPAITSEIMAVSRDIILNPSMFVDCDLYITETRCGYIHHESRIASLPNQNFLEFQAQIANLHNLPLFERFRLEGSYWTFMESHPNHRTLPKATVNEASAALTWCYADRVLYEASNAPFEKENAREMLDLIQNISNLADNYDAGPTGSIIQSWYCAAVMRAVVYDRRHTHYGRRRAAEVRRRAQSDDISIVIPFGSPVEWLVWHIAGVLAFGSPFGYLKRINNVDRTIIQDGINTIRWRAFLKELCKEWTDSNLLATVLVSGTVALLTIPGLNGMAQISGLLSALCALGSVLAGTLLVSNHQSRIESSSNAAFIYFEQAKSHGMGTTRPLAVILSLPVSLMLWGMFWFVFAIASCAYDSGLPGISDKYLISTRVIILSFVLAFLVLGALVVLFLYKVWVSPSVTPIVGQAARNKLPVPQGAVQVDIHNTGQNVLPKNTTDMLPDYPGYMPPLTQGGTQVLPQSGNLPSISPALVPPQHRRTTVEFDESPIVIPPPVTPSARSTSIYSESHTNSGPGRPPFVYTPPSSIITSPLTSGYSNPNGLTTSTYPTSMEAPLLSAFTYPGTPSSGYFVDFDLRRLAPFATATTPEFHLFQRGSQLTLIASTGQVALLLTTQNQGIWGFLLEDDLRYTALVTDIRNTCEQYGAIESINVPRRAAYQVRAEAIGQACIKFTRPEDASRALRGFMDRPLEHCPVSARLLTEEEELAWGVSRRTLHPDLPTVAEEGSVYEDAASLRTLPTVENIEDQRPTEMTLGESIPHSQGQNVSQPGANPLVSPPDAALSSDSAAFTADPWATPGVTAVGTPKVTETPLQTS